MKTRALSRVAALALAALFLGGVGGASDLDAFLFHRGGAAVTAGIAHVENASGSACHSERCVLALRLANATATPRLDLQIRFEAIPQHDAGARPESAPRRAPEHRQQQPRAPPVAVA